VLCTSVNQEVVHGIPHKDKKLKEGDIIGIDFGLVYKGYVGDSARTVSVGKQPKASVAELLVVTKRALDKGIAVCEPGARLSEIGRVVEAEAKVHDYGVVRDFVGHGIGTAMHEEPQVPNYYDGPKPKMPEGLVIAIEPMFTLGTERVRVEADGWTAVTLDHSWAAHFEDSLAITSKGPRILSRL
jgi:methionyl aminopeptidase